MLFEGFTSGDFDAYEPEKWSSNMFTLARRKVKDKLDMLGRSLGEIFLASGVELVPHLSDDHPSLWNKKQVDTQWLFFSRNEAAKKEISDIIDTERTLAATLADPTPLFRHIFIGVSLNKQWLEVGIRLHYDAWVDRKNMLTIAQIPKRRDAFAAICHKSPDAHMQIGLSNSELLPLLQISPAQIADIAAAFENQKGWLFIGRRWDAASASATGKQIADEISACVTDLVELYRFWAWSPGNDAISIDKIVAEKHEQREAYLRELENEQQEREAKRAEEQSEGQKHREETEQRIRDDEAWRDRERAIRRAQAIARAEEDARFEAKRRDTRASAPSDSAAETLKSADTAEPVVEPDGNAMPSILLEQRAPISAPVASEAVSRDSFRKQPVSEDRKPRPVDRRPGPDNRRPRPDDRSTTRPAQRPPRDNNRPASAPRAGMPASSSASASIPVVSDKRREDIQTSDSVEVLSGFLKGRVGIVQSVDEKGDLKVNFGALAARVPRKDVKGLGPI